MSHVLIPTRINPLVFNPRHWVFLAQKPLQILGTEPVGQLKPLPPKVINHRIEDMLTQRLQRWKRLPQVLRIRVNAIGIPSVRLRASAKLLQRQVLSQQVFMHLSASLLNRAP